jgi:hypothetical protein
MIYYCKQSCCGWNQINTTAIHSECLMLLKDMFYNVPINERKYSQWAVNQFYCLIILVIKIIISFACVLTLVFSRRLIANLWEIFLKS